MFFVSQPILIAVASEILPRKWRPTAQGGLNAAGGIGGVVAFLGGQSLIDSSPDGWRKIWYVVTALMGASGLIIAALYWPPPMPLQKTLTTGEKLGRLDWIGYILLAFSLTLVCMGLSWAESPYPWSNAHVVATIVVGGVLLIALVIHQVFFQKHGLLDHDLFKKDRNFAISIACFCLDGMIFWAYTAYFPFQMATNYHYDQPATEGARNCMVSDMDLGPGTTETNHILSDLLHYIRSCGAHPSHLILHKVNSRANSRIFPLLRSVLRPYGRD